MDLLQDLRHAVRRLVKNPGFAVVAVLTLALGIGANTALFSVVKGVLLDPLPFESPSRLAMVWLDNKPMGVKTDITSYPTYLDWRERSRAFEDMAGWSGGQVSLTGEFEPQRVRGPVVTANLFRLLGVSPALGRGFTEDEEVEGQGQVVVLGHGLWQQRFGGDPEVLGRSVRVNGQEHRVVGVMPEGFDFPSGAQLWRPLAPSDQLRSSRGSFFLYVLGRLAPGVDLPTAQADAERVNASVVEEAPQLARYGMYVEPLRDHLVGDVRLAVLVLFGAVGLVLLIACVNVANLLLARSAARQREVAVQLALGSGRGRLVRQLLTESAVLGLAGGAGGVTLALWGVDLVKALAPADLPRVEAVGVDVPVLVFALALSLATGVLFGLVPAWQSSRVPLTEPLREGGRGGSVGGRAGRLRSSLVLGEVALAVVLMVGAGLLIQSFGRLQGVESGFEERGVLTARIALSGPRYQGQPEQVIGFYERLMDRVAGLPGVQEVAAGSEILLEELPWSADFTVEGRPTPTEEERIELTIDAVTPGFFRAVGTTLTRGRDIAPTDVQDSEPVAVVNEAMVTRYWPAEDPIGRRFKFGSEDSESPWITVVGVVADARRTGPDREARPSAYLPHRQLPVGAMMLVVRAAGDPLLQAAPVRAAVREVDPDQPVSELATLEALLSERLAHRRLTAVLSGVFSGLALLLAVVGIYGVISYSVSQSTREIGIRMALGAEAGDVVGMVLRRVGLLIAGGVALGLMGALAVGRVLSGLLFEVSATDPGTFLGVPLILAAVALAASWLPTRRATRVEPVVALRRE